MSGFRKLALSAATVGLLAGIVSPGTAQAAEGQSVARATVIAGPGASITVKEGTRTPVKGQVPAKYAKSLVVLEAISKGRRHTLATGISDRSGAVTAVLDMGGDGTYPARWRVVRDGKTLWTSQRFTIDVKDSGQRHPAAEEAARIASHGGAAAPAPKVRPGSRDGDKATNAAGSAEDAARDDTSQTAAGWVKDQATTAVSNVPWDFEAIGVNLLFGLMDPGTAVATAAQVQALTTDVNQGFAGVNQRLTTIEKGMADLQSSVNAVSTQVQQAAAVAAAGQCATLLQQADSQVETIQGYYANYKGTMSPTWAKSQLEGQPPQQVVKLVGEKIFGANGAGTPTFAAGVDSLQVTVTDLGGLMTGQGPAGSAGVVQACSTAVSASVASQYNSNTSGSIVPLGAVEEAYYSSMNDVVAYYTAWANIGQALAFEGALLEQVALTPSVTSAYAASQVCTGITASNTVGASPCATALWHSQNSTDLVRQAWNAVGASWSDVSLGMVAGDARADNTSDFIQPSRNGWLRDVGSYGLPLVTAAGERTAPATLTSTTAVTSTTPTAVTGASGLSQSTWNGAAFAPATTKAWQWLLPVQSMSASANTATYLSPAQGNAASWNEISTLPNGLGSYMGQAGLTNGGQAPRDLIIYTGETTPVSLQLQNGPGGVTYPAIQASTMSLIDTNVAMQAGSNPVINAPSGSAGRLLDYTYVMSFSDYLYGTVSSPGTNESAWAKPPLSVPTGVQTTWMNPSTEGAPCYTGDATKRDPNVYCSWSFPGVTATPSEFQSLYSVQITPSPGEARAPNLPGTFFPVDVTNSPGFYRNLVQQYSVNVEVQTGERNKAIYSDPSSSVLQVPGFMTGVLGTTDPQTQHGWPTLTQDGASCSMTSFKAGTNSPNVGNVCQQWFIEWLAGTKGVSTGPVTVTGGEFQGTKQPDGNYAVTELVSNTSSSPQKITMVARIKQSTGIEFSGSMTKGDSLGAGGNGADIQNCTVLGTQMICTVVVQPGATLVTLPLSGSFTFTREVEVALAAQGMADYSTVTITTAESGAQAVPGQVRYESATPQEAGDVDLMWLAPQSSPAITSYAVRVTDPDQNQTTLTWNVGDTAMAAPPGSGMSGTAIRPATYQGASGYAKTTVNVGLPHAAGTWFFEVYAENPVGRGKSDGAYATLGNSAPPIPENFTAVETERGTLLVDWDPVPSQPAVSDYTLTITPPSVNGSQPKARTVSTSVTQFEWLDVVSTGMWSFSLVASNAAGNSPEATATVNATGMVPTQPTNLEISVDREGWISVSWGASASVPNADTYHVALFDPDRNLIKRHKVQTFASEETVRLFNMHQLAPGDKKGTWAVIVLPENSIGPGLTPAISSFYVSEGLLKEVKGTLDREQALASIPDHLKIYAQRSCESGAWHDGLRVFGECTDQVYVGVDGTASSS